MGQMRFLVPRPERVPKDAVQRAYMAGMEYVPWPCRTRWENDQLILERDIEDSGNLFIPWQIAERGELVLSTASLMERAEPYNLPLELARGTITRLRNQLALWEPQGFVVTQELADLIRSATKAFITAATSQSNLQTVADTSDTALVHAVDAINLLIDGFTNQVFSIRHQQLPQLPTLLAAHVAANEWSPEQRQQCLSAFNMAVVPFNWRDVESNESEHDWQEVDRQIEACRAAGMKICGGPLLRLYQGNLPDWLYLWEEEDFEAIRSCALTYVEEVVKRYRGMIHIWHVAAGMNTTGTLALPEEYKLKLTVDAIQTVVHTDSRAPVVVSFDQPWAEYLAREDLDLSPIHFADALVRADLGIAGIGLEINFAYWPGGTLPRELLEINRLLDYWSHLGLPLIIILTIPSSAEPDPHARRTARAVESAFPQGLTPDTQQHLADRLISMLLSKQCVHAVIWNQLSDSTPHDFPHGGLFDQQQQPKPVLELLAQLRQKHLT